MSSKLRHYGSRILLLAVFGSVLLVAGRELASGLGLSFLGEGEPESGSLTNDPRLSDDPAAVSPRGNWSVEDATSFAEFPVFWAGEEYAGVPLEAIIRANYVSAVRAEFTLVEDTVSFLYGSCILPESREGGCPSPYQVTVQPACMLPPGFAERSLIDAETTVRGAPAEIFADGHLILWTQDVAITVFAPDRVATLAIAEKIVPLNSSGRLSGSDFAPAIPTGELGCAPDSPAAKVAGRAD